MTPAETLAAARAAGVGLILDGEGLVVSAASPPSADLLAHLAVNKVAIVALLQDGDGECPVVDLSVPAPARTPRETVEPLPAPGVCLWCGSAYSLRRGGVSQRFCSASHRTAFHTACRTWAAAAVLDGRLSLDLVRAPSRGGRDLTA